MPRTMFEMGTTIRSLVKRDACIAACHGTMFIFTALLGLTIWLQVVALQFEIRTLRGRVECLERSHELHIELKAFSETELHSKLTKLSGNENMIYPLSEEGTSLNRKEDSGRNAATQKNNSNKRNYIRIYKDRVRRDAGSDNRRNILPTFKGSQDFLFNWTHSGNSSQLHDLPNQDSSLTSLPSTASYKTSAGVPTEKKLLQSLRKNKDTRHRKKHNRTDISYASTTWKYPTSTEAAIISRPFRVMKTSTGFLGSMILPPTFRSQPIYEESRASPTAVVRPFTRNRRRRPKHEVISGSLETLDERTVPRTRDRHLVAAHYHGDTSRYTSAHEHYDGNGRLRHPDGIFRDWTSAPWMHTLGMNRHLSLSDHGVVNIRSSGLYFLYVQIYYVDTHDTNGFRLYVNSDAILQCTTHSSNADHSVKANTCFTASVAYLNTNDNVSVSDIEGLRYSLFEPAKSFFGFFKVGENKLR